MSMIGFELTTNYPSVYHDFALAAKAPAGAPPDAWRMPFGHGSLHWLSWCPIWYLFTDAPD